MRTATAFQQAAQKQDPAVFDYAREVEQVWRDFPETKESVYFVDLCAGQDKLICPGDPERKELLRQLINNKRDLLLLVDRFQTREKSSCYMPYENNKYGFILLYTQKHSFNFLTETSELGQETAFVFDHELGHAMIPDGITDFHPLGECVADAYALIRHLQRYGADSQALDPLVENRALHFIFRKDRWDHFSSTVTEQILARRYNIEWNSMSPEETKKLARRFALEYVIHVRKLNILDKTFKKFHGKIEALQKGDATPFLELAEEVLSTDIPDVFKWGMAALKMALDGHLSKSYNITLTGDDWDNLRQKLAERQKSFDAQPGTAAKNVVKFPAKPL